MIDFSSWLDLPLVWGGLIATVIFIYIMLDGFDLGSGILFPLAPSDNCRNQIMNSIAPFWDGNETWLVMGGGGLFVAFPLAYAILLPALYLPIILMLLGLVFRGVAFEFRSKASDKQRPIWDFAFFGGSLLATFMQGVILGNLVQGVEADGRNFAGGSLDWVNGFAILTGLALIFGYALLGATWLVMKTEGEIQRWARQIARVALSVVALAMAIITIVMVVMDARIAELWLTLPNVFYLTPIPLLTAGILIVIWRDMKDENREVRPFLLSLGVFFLAYIGLIITLYPWIVPFEFTLWQAAAAPTSQSFMLIGTVFLLPIILTYTGYSYYVFRGKSGHETMY